VAERWKMVRLRSTAKNRLHSILHRFQIVPPGKGYLFAQKRRDWWESLPLPETEKTIVKSYLATLDFAQQQVELFEARLKVLAAADERMPLLAQLPGVSLITGMTILAAVGEIERFSSAKHLVGYAGLGAGVDQSGVKYRTGRITKAGRKDLRHAMVEAARIAAQSHPKWQAEYDRLSPRLGRNKAIVAIARKLLVAVWHILTRKEVDRFADERRVAKTLYALGFKIGTANLPEKNVRQYVRNRLDDLGIGADLERFPYGRKKFVTLPPSRLLALEKE
jgi:transposase